MSTFMSFVLFSSAVAILWMLVALPWLIQIRMSRFDTLVVYAGLFVTLVMLITLALIYLATGYMPTEVL